MNQMQVAFLNRFRAVLVTCNVALCFACLPVKLAAQWLPSGATTGPIYYNGGNVGIGTSTPSAPVQIHVTQTVATPGPVVDIVSDNAEYDELRVESFSGSSVNYGGAFTGVSGRGTAASPEATASGDCLLVLEARGYTPAGTQSVAGFILIGAESAWTNTSTPTFIEFKTNASGTSSSTRAVMHITSSGNVGIGTTSPAHLLHVAGTIGAEQVIVSATGADYVFDPAYRLAPLVEVEHYVAENHHLPGIPSAEEMKKDGVSLGDMQTKLLAKVEELTLHMIELEKKNQELRERLARIESDSKSKR